MALQLFGSEPELMAEMAASIEDLPFDILDINMGCPVPKIVDNGEGSALMKDPALAGKIEEIITKAIKKPVTVKFRKGFTDDIVNAVEIAKSPGSLRRGCRRRSWPDAGAVLFRYSGLGDYPAGERGGIRSGYRKWRRG